LSPGSLRAAGPALVFAASAAAGYMAGPAARGPAESLLEPLLAALALAVGAYIASGLAGPRRPARATPTAALTPAALAASTLAAGLLAGAAGAPLLGLDPRAGAAIAAGSGWYSFTGSYLALYDPLLGLLGFASNLLREAIVIAGYPLLARLAGPTPAIAAGGATTMDTTLPIIARHSGPQTAAIALAHGAILTLAIPLLLPATYP